MSHSLTEVASFDAAIVVPDDGDAEGAASVQTPLQSLANRTKFLNAHSQASTTETRGMPFLLGFNSGWSVQSADNTVTENAAGGSSDVANLMLELPNGQALTAITVNIKPATGAAHSSAPNPMPTIKAWAVSLSGGAVTQLGATTADVFTTQAAYEAAHPITISGISHTIDRTAFRYLVQVFGEGATNGVAGLKIISATATWTRTTFGND